ncbi:MAG TPA: prenyltransferase [Clostridia bacterium]|nr:prenyltransferase [Clostridia bacterium]
MESRRLSSTVSRALYILETFPSISRAIFLVGSVLPVLLGSSVAYYEGFRISPASLLLSISQICFIHLLVNVSNDYYDYRMGADPSHEIQPFSGGSQAIQRGILTEKEMAAIMLALLGFVSANAVILALVRQSVLVAVFVVLGTALGFSYSAEPVCLAKRGAGELVTGLCLGPLAVMASYYVQAGTQTGMISTGAAQKGFDSTNTGVSVRFLLWSPVRQVFDEASALAAGPLFPSLIWSSIIIGILITTILVINEHPDCDNDRASGKMNLIARIGRRKGTWLLAGLYITGLVLLILGAVTGRLPRSVGVATLGLLPGITAVQLIDKKARSPRAVLGDPEYTRAGALGFVTYCVTGSLLILSWLLGA